MQAGRVDVSSVRAQLELLGVSVADADIESFVSSCLSPPPSGAAGVSLGSRGLKGDVDAGNALDELLLPSVSSTARHRADGGVRAPAAADPLYKPRGAAAAAAAAATAVMDRSNVVSDAVTRSPVRSSASLLHDQRPPAARFGGAQKGSGGASFPRAPATLEERAGSDLCAKRRLATVAGGLANGSSSGGGGSGSGSARAAAGLSIQLPTTTTAAAAAAAAARMPMPRAALSPIAPRLPWAEQASIIDAASGRIAHPYHGRGEDPLFRAPASSSSPPPPGRGQLRAAPPRSPPASPTAAPVMSSVPPMRRHIAPAGAAAAAASPPRRASEKPQPPPQQQQRARQDPYARLSLIEAGWEPADAARACAHADSSGGGSGSGMPARPARPGAAAHRAQPSSSSSSLSSSAPRRPTTDRVNRYRELRAAWDRDPFLRAGGATGAARRPLTGYREYFAAAHADAEAERRAAIAYGRGG